MITLVENAKCFEDLADSGDFEELDSKLSTAMNSLIPGESKLKVQVQETELSKQGLPITRRQITWMLYDLFKVSENDGTLLDWDDIKGDNLTQVLTDWENTFLNISEIPSDSMLECLLRKQLEKSEQLKNAISLTGKHHSERGGEVLRKTPNHSEDAHRSQKT